MSLRNFICLSAFLLLALAPRGAVRAQSVCESGNGPLLPDAPVSLTPAQIIQKFAANEAAFKAARERYGYTLEIKVQTVDNYGHTDGEYHQVSEVALNDLGKRVEKPTFAPQSTLRRLALSESDMDDIRERIPFALTPDEFSRFSISYVGRQPVDELNTYVFDVSPKNTKKEKNLFQGRIWVDNPDLMIVKTCGKPREDEGADSTKRNAIVNLTPVFVTFREQIDGKFWFPTYAKADELMRFPNAFVHIREVVRYTNYKPLAQPR